MKICSGCKSAKPKDEFYRNKAARDGLTSYCKPCQDTRNKHWWATHPEAAKRKVERRKPRLWVNNLTPAQKEARSRRVLKVKYGQYAAEALILRESKKTCAICGVPFTGVGTDGSYGCVDHCHSCGRPRDMVCRKCNVAIGLLNDSVPMLEKAIVHLKAHACEKVIP